MSNHFHLNLTLRSTAALLLTLIVTLSQVFVADALVLHQPLNQSQELYFDHIQPLSCHSHNDYWRKSPLYSALWTGCTSVEADVIAREDELFITHTRGEMKPDHTLSHMYLDPLLSILSRQNPSNSSQNSINGVYGQEPNRTLVLLVDFKVTDSKTWPLLLEKLQPFREHGWLSHIDDGSFISRPITIVVSGSARLEDVDENPSRDVFFDAPLNHLDKKPYNSNNSYYGSVAFKKSIGHPGSNGLSEEQLVKVRRQIHNGHNLGLKVRYFAISAKRGKQRDDLWRVLMNEGVDSLNVDDLEHAKEMLLKFQSST